MIVVPKNQKSNFCRAPPYFCFLHPFYLSVLVFTLSFSGVLRTAFFVLEVWSPFVFGNPGSIPAFVNGVSSPVFGVFEATPRGHSFPCRTYIYPRIYIFYEVIGSSVFFTRSSPGICCGVYSPGRRTPSRREVGRPAVFNEDHPRIYLRGSLLGLDA